METDNRSCRWHEFILELYCRTVGQFLITFEHMTTRQLIVKPLPFEICTTIENMCVSLRGRDLL